MSPSVSDLYTASGKACSVPAADEEGTGTVKEETILEREERVTQEGRESAQGHSADEAALCPLPPSLETGFPEGRKRLKQPMPPCWLKALVFIGLTFDEPSLYGSHTRTHIWRDIKK